MSSDMKMPSKVGAVDVGGGYRGIYAAGVLGYCLDQAFSSPWVSEFSQGAPI